MYNPPASTNSQVKRQRQALRFVYLLLQDELRPRALRTSTVNSPDMVVHLQLKAPVVGLG